MQLTKDRFENFLNNIKDKIEYARIVFFLRNIPLAIEEVLIDDSAMNSALLQVGECSFSDIKTGHLFSNDKQISPKLIKNFRQKGPLHFKCVPETIYDHVKRAWDIIDIECFGLWYLPEDTVIPSDETAYRVESLREQDIETVNQNWDFGRGKISDFLKSQILNNSTFAVYIEDKLASYAVLRENGSMGMLRTVPEYRGLGLARVITLAMLRALRKKGWLPHCYIDNSNTKSQKVAMGCGLRFYSTQYWFRKIKK